MLVPYILSIFNSCYFPLEINSVLLTLIPKCSNLVSPSHLRPIALSNMLAKLITKIIANRLKTVLPSLVGEH